jgi:GT2 family glycosyltransferase
VPQIIDQMNTSTPAAPHEGEKQAVNHAQGSAAVCVSVLIVAYNSLPLLAHCLASVPTACTSQGFEILLIDNGDGSCAAYAAEHYPEVRVVPSRGNIGFAAGNNVLAAEARGRYLLLLNPDMILFPAAIDALLDGAAAHPEASAWGGVTVDADGVPDSGNAVPVPSLAEFASAALGRSLQDKLPRDRLRHDGEVKVLMGGFVMIARKAWDAVGGFDERYFLYCEEVDLFHRLAAKGHRFWRIADARGQHLAGHGQGTSPMRTLYLAAGRAEFMRAHWSIPRRIAGLVLLWIAACERYVMGSLFGRWRPRLRARNEALRLLVRRPWLWMRGYDEQNGLLVQLKRLGGKIS